MNETDNRNEGGKLLTVIDIILLAAGVLFLLLPFYIGGAGWAICGTATVIFALFLFALKKRNVKLFSSSRALYAVSLLLAATSFALEMVPGSLIMLFNATPTTKIGNPTFYLSELTFGYADFAPFICAVMTAAVIVTVAIKLISKAKANALSTAIIVLSLIAFCLSLLVFVGAIFALHAITVYNIVIAVSLAASSGASIAAKLKLKQ